MRKSRKKSSSSKGRKRKTRTDTEEKKSWYKGSSLSPKQLKFCRCLLEQHANELERYKKVRTNTYAICTASVGTKTKLRSVLVATARSGLCTKELHLDKLPTKLLYAYAHLRKTTKKGAPFFKHVPSPTRFFQDPEHYRVSLLRACEKYQTMEQSH